MKSVIFITSACWLIFKIVNITVSVNAMMLNELDSKMSRNLTTYQAVTDIYIPPNNGGPDSQHGSGTR